MTKHRQFHTERILELCLGINNLTTTTHEMPFIFNFMFQRNRIHFE